MARTLRIDSVTNGSGVNIGVTASNGTLPASPSKLGFSFKSKTDLTDAMKALENSLTDEQLLLILIAVGYKQDNTMTTATLNGLIGKTVALSLTSGAQLVRVV